MQDGRALLRGGQARAAPLQGRRGLPDRPRPASRAAARADRGLSLDPGDPARRRALAAPTPSIRATGFLSESPEFAEACAAAGITFIGPSPETMRRLGNKVAARELASRAGVPVMPATDPLPDDPESWKRLAEEIGYPLMLKASWGGGGRGMRVIRDEAALVARRDGGEARGEGRLRQGRGLSRKAGRARPPHRGADSRRHGTATACTSSSATAPSSAATRRSSSARRRRTSTQEQREELCGYALKIADAAELCLRRHGGVPAGRRRPENSTSSRSIRASRSSTPSPRR